jgi:hypothetical protein
VDGGAEGGNDGPDAETTDAPGTDHADAGTDAGEPDAWPEPWLDPPREYR